MVHQKTIFIILRILNKLKVNNSIENYALAGSTALNYLLNNSISLAPNDVDIIIKYNNGWGNARSNIIKSIQEEIPLETKKIDDNEYLIIEGVLFHFLWYHYSELFKDALNNYKHFELNNLQINIIPIEYLMAILISSDEDKHKNQLSMISEDNYDKYTLNNILKNHDLETK